MKARVELHPWALIEQPQWEDNFVVIQEQGRCHTAIAIPREQGESLVVASRLAVLVEQELEDARRVWPDREYRFLANKLEWLLEQAEKEPTK